MSTQAKIHCHRCNNDFYLYDKDFKEGSQIKCPFCKAELKAPLDNEVLRLMNVAEDLNYHLRKYHSERDEDLFTVNVEWVELPDDI